MKEKKGELIILIGCLLLITLTVTMAYFMTKIEGEGKEIVVNSKELKVIFAESNTLSSTNIEPGWSKTSTFTVKNETDGTYKYNISISDLVNTFVTEGYLQYKITSTDGGYNMSEYKDIPKSETATNTVLAYSVEIAKNTTHSYSIVFRYASTTEDQSDDMGKILSGSLVIEKGTEGPSLEELILAKSETNEDGVYNENGYRYEGSNPNNYIKMKKSDGTYEMWRIIGLFPDGENGENVIRVRRYYEQGSYPTMAYDTNKTNHWPKTTMYSSLSSTYSLANYANTVNFKMYLGTSSTGAVSEAYSNERGSTPGGTASTSYSSSVLFTGPVGLMYPSDYGYSVLASDCARTIKLNNYSGTTACKTNNWLYQGSSQDQWAISPTSFASIVFKVSKIGYLDDEPASTVTFEQAYSPVMALSSDTTVKGSGSISDPYVIN